MNLKDAINYRTQCYFCQQPTKLIVYGYPKLQVKTDDKGITVFSVSDDQDNLFYGFDGTYRHSKRKDKSYKIGIYKLRNNPVELWAGCPSCTLNDESLTDHSKLLLNATLDNLEANVSVFTFMLYPDLSRNSYQVRPNADVIKHFNPHTKTFHHWAADFRTDTTWLYSARMSDSLDNILNLHLPAVNLSGVKTKEEFLSKFQMYVSFS